MKKFSLKKFKKDRERSYEGSKSGDYKLIEHNEGRNSIKEIISELHDIIEPIECKHKKIGCELPYTKRTLDICNKCYFK